MFLSHATIYKLPPGDYQIQIEVAGGNCDLQLRNAVASGETVLPWKSIKVYTEDDLETIEVKNSQLQVLLTGGARANITPNVKPL